MFNEDNTFRALKSRITHVRFYQNNTGYWLGYWCYNDDQRYSNKGDALSDLLATYSELPFDYETYNTSKSAKLYDWGTQVTNNINDIIFTFYIDNTCYKVTTNTNKEILL